MNFTKKLLRLMTQPYVMKKFSEDMRSIATFTLGGAIAAVIYEKIPLSLGAVIILASLGWWFLCAILYLSNGESSEEKK